MKITRISKVVRKLLPARTCSVVIVAAGNASRMSGIDKVMALLDGEPMIVRTVRTFQQSELIKEIVVVTRPDLIIPVLELCAEFDKLKAVVVGGENRSESVQAGLSAIACKTGLVAVHDGARPLVSQQIIDRTVMAASNYGAAAPAIQVKDTIKIVRGGIVSQTPDRSTLRAVQTPQVFDYDLLRSALQKAKDCGTEITDDCSAVELLQMSVKIVEGEERNLKVTTPMDLKIAEMLLEEMK